MAKSCITKVGRCTYLVTCEDNFLCQDDDSRSREHVVVPDQHRGRGQRAHEREHHRKSPEGSIL